MVMRTISESPAGVNNMNSAPTGLSVPLAGLPNRVQAINQAETAIAYGTALIAFGLTLLLFLKRA